MATVDRGTVVYPESDGQRMAENEIQGFQMRRLVEQLDRYFGHRDDVHVGFDLLWYPVEGDPSIYRAPDVFVVPGRPKGPARRSWLQWQEDGVPMRHVIEILAPSNTPVEMIEKRRWYNRYGVEEYLVFDPETGVLDIHIRNEAGLATIDTDLPWASAVLEGCAYRVDPAPADIGDDLHDLVLLDPDGTKVETHEELAARIDQAEKALARADALAAQLRAAGIEPEA